MALYRVGSVTRGTSIRFPAGLALSFTQLYEWGLGSTTDPIPPPEAKPWAMREHFVVPSIGRRDVARAERPNVRSFEHFP